MIPTITMEEENMMDDAAPQTARSESAFFGTNDERRRISAESTKPPLTVDCKAYLVGSGKLRFDLWKPSLERRSGVKFENGVMYVVRGTIGDRKFESRHVGSVSPHVYVFVDGGTPEVVPGQRYGLLVEAIEEKRRFEVVPSRSGPCIRVTRPVLEGLGVRTDERSIIELMVKRPGDREARRVYSHWEPDWGFIQLYLGGIGFAVGDVVEVVGGRNYSLEGFVGDFMRHKLNELANVELAVESGRLDAKVDGKPVPVERYWLDTHGLKVALKLELGYNQRMMKFTFDGTAVEGRLLNSDPILEYSASRQGLEFRYVRTRNQVYVMKLGQRPQLGSVQSLGWLAGGIRVVSRPGVTEGQYALEIAESVQEETRRRINSTRDDQQYRKARGDIFEEMVQSLLGEMRMKLLYDHPWSNKSARCGTMREGPDFMVKLPDTGAAFYLEAKWWEDIARAFTQGTKQARDYARQRSVWRGLRIVGAYIAVLDWKVTKPARMLIERVA